jgi:hypothetical protein
MRHQNREPGSVNPSIRIQRSKSTKDPCCRLQTVAGLLKQTEQTEQTEETEQTEQTMQTMQIAPQYP